jgi:hypothetical protein
MSTPPLPPAVTAASPATAYAVLRVDRRKAKAMAAIAAASGHQMRSKHTPNADPKGPAPLVLFLAGGGTPYQAAQHLLTDAERRNRDTVLCREIVVSASPSYFRPGRDGVAGVYDAERVKAWASVTLAWAKRTWPDQLAAMTLHLDEQTPHAHLMVVPRMRAADGKWKLNSKALFDRERLRDLQTSYGEAVAPLGIRRGEPGSKATHAEVRQFYGAVQAAKAMPQRAPVPAAPKRPKPPEGIAERLAEGLAALVGMETAHQRAMKRHASAVAAWREKVQEAKRQDACAWETMQAMAAFRPVKQRTQKRDASPAPPASARQAPRSRPRP